jgi:hypothetical protein
MVARSYIKQNLHFCIRKHARAKKKEAIFLAKMAVLELCGWIELSFDEIVLKCAKKNLRLDSNFNSYEKETVRKTYGFEYDKHFSNMLIKLIGLINFEAIESKVDQQKLAKLKAALGTLKAERNREAHTYVKGTTRTIMAPSLMVSLFQDVDAGIVEFEREIRNLRF